MYSIYESAVSRAYDIGREHGVAAGSWVIDGNTSPMVAEAILRGMEDGDPAVLDQLPSSPLSGEWADSYSPAQLYDDLDWSADADLSGAILDAYEEGFGHGVNAEVERSARAILDS